MILMRVACIALILVCVARLSAAPPERQRPRARELGFYLISDGGPNPYRYRVRPPSFINLTVLEDLCLGHTVADVMVILGSIDIVMGEVDR